EDGIGDFHVTGVQTCALPIYDMWWNPAVENQATDRVHRIGQKNAVSSYKLVTMGTIEEKIVELQERKKGLVKKVINTDEEAISRSEERRVGKERKCCETRQSE